MLFKFIIIIFLNYIEMVIQTNFQLLSLLQVGDIEGDVPSAKRLRKSSSDALQDMVNGEELSLYGSAPNSTETSQVEWHSVNILSIIWLLYFHIAFS